MKNNKVARRKLLQFGAVALGSGLATRASSAYGNSLKSKGTLIALDTLDEKSTPRQVLDELIAGNKRFVNNRPEGRNQDYIRLVEVSQGQKPLVSILGCADSRVPIEVVFDRGLGDLFVVRDAGNIATPEEIGSLEYGTYVLGSKVLMVMGHEKCGAVKAALDGKPLPGQIGSIVKAIAPSIDRTKQDDSEEFYVKTIKDNVMLQVKRLNESPLVQELVQTGKLIVVGAYYKLRTGEVILLS